MNLKSKSVARYFQKWIITCNLILLIFLAGSVAQILNLTVMRLNKEHEQQLVTDASQKLSSELELILTKAKAVASDSSI